MSGNLDKVIAALRNATEKRGTGNMYKKIVSFIVLWWISMVISGPVRSEAYSDRVVAVVNGDVVLESDIQNHKKPFIRGFTNLNLGVIPPGKWPTERELLDELIVIHLLDQEAEKQGFRLDEKAVDASIDSLKKRNKLSHDRFVVFLAANGLNYADFRKLWKRQLRLKGLISREVTTKVPISEEDAQIYFKKNRDKIDEEFKKLLEKMTPPQPPPEKFVPDVPTHEERFVGGKVRLRIITIKLSPRSGRKALARAKRKAKKIADELMQGASFAEMAKKYSEDQLASKGGDLGFMNYNDMERQWQQLVQRMQVGQVLGPIKGNQAIMIFYLDDAKGRTTKKVRIPEKVRRKLIEQQRALYEKQLAERKKSAQPPEPPREPAKTEAVPKVSSSASTAAKDKNKKASAILSPEEEREYRKVRDKVLAIVRSAKIRERMKDWIEELKKKSIIEVKL